MPKCFSKSCQFTHARVVYENLYYFKFITILVLWTLNFCQSHALVIVAPCSFNLPSLNTIEVAHLFICLLVTWTSFGNACTSVLPVFLLISFSFKCWIVGGFHILWILESQLYANILCYLWLLFFIVTFCENL